MDFSARDAVSLMAAWNENPENDLRETELHREAVDAYFGVPDDDREPEPYDEWSGDDVD